MVWTRVVPAFYSGLELFSLSAPSLHTRQWPKAHCPAVRGSIYNPVCSSTPYSTGFDHDHDFSAAPRPAAYEYRREGFPWILSGITLATKMFEARIRRAGLTDHSAPPELNVQGEQQQKLDVYANEAMLHCLGVRDNVITLVSEENEEPITLQRDSSGGAGRYIIVFDPLDGSSNIDVNVSVGTNLLVLICALRDHWRSGSSDS